MQFLLGHSQYILSVYETLNSLKELNPDFISVTYGAGGSKSKKTIEIASYISNTLHIEALSHMTCVGNTKDDIRRICEQLTDNNLSQVLALRGDRPQTMSDEQFFSREFKRTHKKDLTSRGCKQDWFFRS